MNFWIINSLIQTTREKEFRLIIQQAWFHAKNCGFWNLLLLLVCQIDLDWYTLISFPSINHAWVDFIICNKLKIYYCRHHVLLSNTTCKSVFPTLSTFRSQWVVIFWKGLVNTDTNCLVILFRSPKWRGPNDSSSSKENFQPQPHTGRRKIVIAALTVWVLLRNSKELVLRLWLIFIK